MIRPLIFSVLFCISNISSADNAANVSSAISDLTDHLVGEINDRQKAISDEASERKSAIESEVQARLEGNADTLHSANAYTDEKLNNYWQKSTKRFNKLDGKINHLNNKLNAAIAGVTAISSIPYVAEDSLSLGIGVGNFRNGNAIAIGSQYKTSQNSNIRVNMSWDSTEKLSQVGVSRLDGNLSAQRNNPFRIVHHLTCFLKS